MSGLDWLWWLCGLVWAGAAVLAVRRVRLRHAYDQERQRAARADHDEWLTTHRKIWRYPLPPAFDRPWAAPHLRREP
jgi:hypothetical protein